jgi:hypothetical protein
LPKLSSSTGPETEAGAERCSDAAGACAGCSFGSAAAGGAAAAFAGASGCGGAERSADAALASPPMGSRTRTSDPSETLSPTFTRSSFTVPDVGDGTSIVALSDSTVMSDSSALTSSPGFTKTSITGTSL